MATARKTPAKKAAPRKTAARRTPATNVEAFEHFRQRASTFTFPKVDVAKQRPPYVLGPDRGFDPPIAIAYPESLPNQIAFDQAVRHEDFFGALGILSGGNMMRIARVFDQFEDGMHLLVGLVLDIIDYYTGAGASDVEGGSPAS